VGVRDVGKQSKTANVRITLLSLVHETIVAVEKQYFSVCMCMEGCGCGWVHDWVLCGFTGAGVCLLACSFTYLACAASPHSVLSGCTTFFGILSYAARLSEKKVAEHEMCVLTCAATFVCIISHSEKNSARYYHKCENVFM
jgi:hypothetical protein